MEFNKKQKVKLSLLFSELNNLIKDLPTILDCHDWKNNIEYVMQEIRDMSDEVYEKLDDLITQVLNLGEQHVNAIDSDEAPSVIARSAELYFQEVAYVTSEINTLKSL